MEQHRAKDFRKGVLMPPAFKVELRPHDPQWASNAEAESQALAAVMGSCLLNVQHIGSTAIPDIHAKPVLDLMPVVTCLAELDDRRQQIEGLGYEWWGELGLPGRRYCSKSDPDTGRRLVQLHCYAQGSQEITRHLAFRDYLRRHPDVARAYDREKIRCRALHPDDSHAYGDCKGQWIETAEAEALTWFASSARD
jgi:GrpB-like predicted nucleotidyltransferase (UPF0157 family)